MSEVKQLSAPQIVLGIHHGKSPEECLAGIEVSNADNWPKVTLAVGCAALMAGFLGRPDIEQKLNRCREIIKTMALGTVSEEVA
jgi:hypothetical protein